RFLVFFVVMEKLDAGGNPVEFGLPPVWGGLSKNSLPARGGDGAFQTFSKRFMSKVCSITGSKPARGSIIRRRCMAKKKGGVGRHVTKNVPRTFNPNLHQHRIWVPELKKFVRLRVTARGLKTINKNGAYLTL